MEFTIEDIGHVLGLKFKMIMSKIPHTPTDIDRAFAEQSDFNMCLPPADDSIYTNQFGAVIMNVNTLNKLMKVYTRYA